CDRRAWARARALLGAALNDSAEPREPGDLERLAVAAHLVGRGAESISAWGRAHEARCAAGDRDAAARCAFWLCILLLLRGEVARAGGWLSRAERLAAEGDGPARRVGLGPGLVYALCRD